MKRKKLYIFFLVILICMSFVNPVFARHYIGDEDPTEFALGEGETLTQVIERNSSLLPALFPEDEEFFEELNWIKYPFEHYYFKTASSKDKGFFQNKIEDVGAVVTDLFATGLLLIEIVLTTLGNSITMVCFHDFWNDHIYTFIGNAAGVFVDGFQDNNIVGLLFIIALIILGISIASYLLRAQIMKAFTAILTSALCIGFFLGYLTIVSSLLPGVITFVNNFSGAALVATHYLKDAPMDPNKPAPVPNKLGPVAATPLTSGLIEATNASWQAVFAGPWAAAQFGYSNPEKLQLSGAEIEQINNDLNGYSAMQKFGYGLNPKHTTDDFKKVFEGRIEHLKQPAYMDTVWLASGGSARESVLEAITDPSLKESNDRRTFVAAGCGQSSAVRHLATSLIMLPAAFLFFLFAVLVGIPVFVAQFILILLIIVMPLALLLGVSGDRGINLLKRYISALLGCLATKIIYGFYFGLILFFAVSMTSFPAMEDKPGFLAFLVAIIFAVAIKYRSPFYEQVIALFSFTPETVGEKASSWFGNTIETIRRGYIYGKIQQTTSRRKKTNNRDNTGDSGGNSNNPDPPGGDSDDTSSNTGENSTNSIDNSPLPPPSGGNTGGGTRDDSSEDAGIHDSGGGNNPEPPPGDNNTGGVHDSNISNTDNPEPPSYYEDRDSEQIFYDFKFPNPDSEPKLNDNATRISERQFDAPMNDEENIVQWDRKTDETKHTETPVIRPSQQSKSHDTKNSDTTNTQHLSPQPEVKYDNKNDKTEDTRIETTRQIHDNIRRNVQISDNQDSQDNIRDEPEIIEPPIKENFGQNE